MSISRNATNMADISKSISGDFNKMNVGHFMRFKKKPTKQTFYCKVCKFKTTFKLALISHKKKHQKEKPFKCDHCGFCTLYKGNLARHLTTHGDKKTFHYDHSRFKIHGKKKHAVKRHIVLETPHATTGRRPYTCQLCNYKTTYKGNLIRHKMLHSGEKPFTCKFCDYKTNQKSNLILHEGKHTGRNKYKCDRCDYTTVYKFSYDLHIKRQTCEKAYCCNSCDYKTVTNSALIRHTKRKHGGRMSPLPSPQSLMSDKMFGTTHKEKDVISKGFYCYLCKKISKATNLIRHERKHPDAERLRCKLCNYETIYKFALDLHERIHSTEKSFNCYLCEYKTTQRDLLLKHRKTHLERQLYQCHLCSFTSTTKSNLQIHDKTHAGEKQFSYDTIQSMFSSDVIPADFLHYNL